MALLAHGGFVFRVLAAAALLGAALTLPVGSQVTSRATRSLPELTLEELLDVTVTSASKRETPLIRSPTAITVITADDILRLGITSIPEALRLVPGVQVGRISSQQWAVSARGFQGIFADKLLVMIDGRTIYEATFPGVNWDAHDVALEDLDRIEVIRGPGATLWGANAVNGVVNIITKSARQTQGALVSVSLGNEERPGVTVRYGGEVNPDFHYRAYVKVFDRDGLVDAAGDDAPLDWRSLRGGFRTDWTPTAADTVMVQGDYFGSETNELEDVVSVSPPFSARRQVVADNRGGFVLGRWNRTLSDTSQLSLQSFASHSTQAQFSGTPVSDIFDLELQHRFAAGRRQDLTWGLGYRLRRDDLSDSGAVVFAPESLTQHLFTAFVQDEITLLPDRLQVSLGSKFEHNGYTGFEVQPGVRLLWTPTRTQALWAAVSRAVRTPDRFEDGARTTTAVIPTGPPGSGTPPLAVTLFGSHDVEAETLIAYELGWRIEAHRRVAFDLATFYDVYDDLTDFVAGPSRFEAPPPRVVLPLNATNLSGGNSRGAELAVEWTPNARWRMVGDYTWLHIRFLDGAREFDSSEHQVRLRSYLDLPHDLELNGAVFYASALRNQPIPSYTRVDLGLLWHPTASIELGVWGQNLLEDRHTEANSFRSSFRGAVPRGFVSRATWRF